jgi:hypothetical protein
LNNNEPLLLLDFYGESCATACAQSWLTLFNRTLNIVRVVITSSNDDQVF